MFELGDFNDNGTCDWLHYDWLEKYTVDSEQVDYMNDKFKDLKQQIKDWHTKENERITRLYAGVSNDYNYSSNCHSSFIYSAIR